jgi:DNA polymerase-3 subunit epsilon
MDPSSLLLAETIFTVIDVETTGLEPEDRVIEVAAVRIQGPREIGRLESLIAPGIHIPPVACAISGIDDRMVAGAPSFADVWPALEELFAGAALVAHNAPFDLHFLSTERKRAGLTTETGPVIDTLRLARNAVELPHYTLAALAESLSLARPPAHRALADTLATVALLRRLIEILGERVRTLGDLLAAQEPMPAEWDAVAAAGVAGGLIDPLRTAAETRQWLDLMYEGRHGLQRLTVQPLALEHNGPLYYVRAVRSGPAREGAALRLDRIREILATRESPAESDA